MGLHHTALRVQELPVGRLRQGERAQGPSDVNTEARGGAVRQGDGHHLAAGRVRAQLEHEVSQAEKQLADLKRRRTELTAEVDKEKQGREDSVSA